MSVRGNRVPLAAAVVSAFVGLLLGGCGGSGPTRPALPRASSDYAGIAAPNVFLAERRQRDRSLARQQRIGLGLLRQTFAWSQIETAPGRYDFSRYDSLVAAAARHRLRVLPILFDPPSFRSGAPRRGAQHGTYPPRRYADLGVFAAVLVKRYGPEGDFWTRHPKVPKLPIRSWQVWNEPNFPSYWPSGPNAGEYAALLKQTSSAIKATDPKAEVVSAGLANTNGGIPFDKYANALYDAGAKASFDTFAIHPYARDADGVVQAVESARKLISRHGDDAPIWVTEIGWATGGPPTPFTVSARGQAQRIRQTFAELTRRRSALGMRGIVYFEWRDSRPSGRADFWGFHTGVLDVHGRPKPGLAALEQAIQALPSGNQG